MKIFTLLLLVWSTMLSSVLAGDRTKVLIIEGQSNHDWKTRVTILKSILSQDSSFEVDVSVTPASAESDAWAKWRPQFSKYDVVISGYNDVHIKGGMRWPREVEKSFEKFVSKGGGFMAFHEANNAFAGWREYNKMIGMGWRNANYGKAVVVKKDESLDIIAAGSGQNTGHGARSNVKVTRRADDHPIYKGLPDSWMAADLEVYRYARGPVEDYTMLTYAKDEKTKLQFPVEWATDYGQGRVYVATYGHVWANTKKPAGIRCAAFQTILPRAIKWLAKKDPGAVVPKDFPSESKISLRP